MIDKVTFVLPRSKAFGRFGINEKLHLNNIDFHPDRNKHSGEITSYVGYLKNLRISIFRHEIKISNSLSRFFYGYNAKDLTLEDLTESIENFCDSMGCEMKQLKVKFLEFGFSIQISVPPVEVFSRLFDHKNAQIEDTIRYTKHVGRKFDHWEYNFKVYDKGFEQKREMGNLFDGNILRLEQQFKSKKIPESIESSFDLVKPENLKKLFEEFSKQWKNIKKAPIIDVYQMDESEKDWYYARMNPIFWQDMRKINANNAKVAKRRFYKDLIEIGDHSIFNEVENAFTKKFHALMQNESVADFPRILVAGKRVQS